MTTGKVSIRYSKLFLCFAMGSSDDGLCKAGIKSRAISKSPIMDGLLRVEGDINLDHRMIAVTKGNSGFTCSFERNLQADLQAAILYLCCRTSYPINIVRCTKFR